MRAGYQKILRHHGFKVSPLGTLLRNTLPGGDQAGTNDLTFASNNAGIPGFYTRMGVGTVIAEGNEFNGETYIMEESIFADLAIVKPWKADKTGNLLFRKAARNFNPPAAMCGRICIAKVEEIVPTGSLDPDLIHLGSQSNGCTRGS